MADRPRVYDDELDPPPSPRREPSDHPPYFFQRLIVNPFLGVLGMVAWYAVLRYFVLHKQLLPLIPAFASLVGVFFLLQYHCLDCGATGRYSRWSDHACDRVVARRESGRPRRFRGPNPRTQLVLWLYLLMAIALLARIVLQKRA